MHLRYDRPADSSNETWQRGWSGHRVTRLPHCLVLWQGRVSGVGALGMDGGRRCIAHVRM